MTYEQIHGTPRQQNNNHNQNKPNQNTDTPSHGTWLGSPRSSQYPPNTSWRLQPRHTMRSMKVSNKVLIHDEAGRRLRPMLRTVPLPVHEVLMSTSSSATLHELADRESLSSIDDAWGRGPNRGRNQCKARSTALTEDLPQVVVLLRNLSQVWSLLPLRSNHWGVGLLQTPARARRITLQDLVPRPIHLGPMLGHPGVAQHDRGMRGVYDQEGYLLLMIPRNPHLEGSRCLCDASQPLSLKRAGH